MNHYFSRLILATSLVSVGSLAQAQFVPEFDLPTVPENTVGVPTGIPQAEGNLGQTTLEYEARQLEVINLTPENNAIINTHDLGTLDAAGFEFRPEGGSETVANFMKMLEPSVDTSIPETPTQAALRINRLINAGHHDNALREIAKLKKSDGNIATPTTDVQLVFLEARAWAGKGDTTKAIGIYREMAYNYPELAEPWNNMAALQMKAGLPEQALESVKMALSIRPNYAIANHNIGLIYTQLANQSFNQARRQGVSAAAEPARKTNDILYGQ